MRKTLYSVFALALGMTACSPDELKELPELPVVTTMKRDLDFTVTGVTKDTIYTTASKIVAEAGFSNFSSGTEKNTFYLYFNAGPHVNNAVGDIVHFQIDRAKLKDGYVGTYTYELQATNLIHKIRYQYMVKDAQGNLQGSINETDMNTIMLGNVTISNYDAARQIISGTYSLSAALIDDPTTFKIGIYPEDQCQLTVSGTFSNVKIKQD